MSDEHPVYGQCNHGLPLVTCKGQKYHYRPDDECNLSDITVREALEAFLDSEIETVKRCMRSVNNGQSRDLAGMASRFCFVNEYGHSAPFTEVLAELWYLLDERVSYVALKVPADNHFKNQNETLQFWAEVAWKNKS